jgi:TatD-related deoxyribonuclease
MSYPVFDNHVHLRREGRFTDAAEEFRRRGGTGLMLVNLPPAAPVTDSAYFEKMYAEAEKLRDGVREATGLTVLLAVGPYPVTLLELAEKLGAEEAERRMAAAAELAAHHVREGRADAIGEVGRPHFTVPEGIMEASNRILHVCLEEAKSAGCAVILHTEEPDARSMLDLARRADSAGMDRGRVVKHHCTDLILPEENHGLFPSVTAKRETVASAAKKGSRFMLETDYIDDPRNPGAFLGIGTVPRRVRELVADRGSDDKIAWEICFENPSAVYGSEKFSSGR